MKKLALAICLLVVSIAAQAQFEKGKMILNPSVTGLDFSYSKNDKAKFGIGAQAGTFLADGIALMVNVGADWSKPVDEYTLGTGMRFYFNSTGVYLGGGLDWNRFRWSGGHHQTDWGLGIEAGYAYFLSRTVTIEPAVYYKWRFNDSDMSRFGVKVDPVIIIALEACVVAFFPFCTYIWAGSAWMVHDIIAILFKSCRADDTERFGFYF